MKKQEKQLPLASDMVKQLMSISRLAIISCIIISLYAITLTGCFIYTINDIGTTETITENEIVDMDTENGNNNYINGDNNGEITNN